MESDSSQQEVDANTFLEQRAWHVWSSAEGTRDTYPIVLEIPAKMAHDRRRRYSGQMRALVL